jgi:hypothetical protein
MGAWAGLEELATWLMYINYFCYVHLHLCVHIYMYAAILATTQQGGGTEDSEHGVESRRWALAAGAWWWTLPKQRNWGM